MYPKAFKAYCKLLPLIMLLASPSLFAAGAAKVEFVWGTAYVLTASGDRRDLAKEDDVEAGDRIISEKALVQLRFSDGGFFSLAPNSEFRINAYSYNGVPDGSERVSMELLKGGLRTISGLIGKARQSAYEMKTAVATVGIRGTEYTVVYGESVSGTVTAGAIAVCNTGGCVDVAHGQSYYVKDLNTPPILVSKAALLPPPPPVSVPPQQPDDKKSAKAKASGELPGFEGNDDARRAERARDKMRDSGNSGRVGEGDIRADIAPKRGKPDITENFKQFDDPLFQKQRGEEALKAVDSDSASSGPEARTASRHNRDSLPEISTVQKKLDDNGGEALWSKGKSPLK